jgi:5-methylcytosine-specific restriction endonuclease McrA
LLRIHGYHPKIQLLEERLNLANLASLGKTEGLKGKLILKQNGKCSICLKSLFLTSDNKTLEAGFLDIDHIVPISEGGSKTNMENIRLLHRGCHIERHKDPN